MLFDCHNHCERSCDSKMKLKDALHRAEELKIGICITEHWDYDYPTNAYAFHFDLSDYKLSLDKVRNDHILMGIEIGMQPHVAELNRILACSLDFDYVLCSIHCMQGKDLYEPTCYEGLTKKQAVQHYLKDMYICLKNHAEIDSLGHIDYITRYWPYKEQLDLDDAKDLWDQVFQILVQREIPMEINTRQIDNDTVLNSMRKIYGRYKKMGGKYVTLGSDAHYDYNVGRRIKEAYVFAKEIGLQPIYYKKRQKIIMC